MGCGPATLWRANRERIDPSWSLTLADFWPGMIEAAPRAWRARRAPRRRCSENCRSVLWISGWDLGRHAEAFGLETGPGQLEAFFVDVRVERFEDGLAVTEAEPLLAYIRFSSVYRGGDLVGARTAVEAPMARSGAFHITKAPGPDQLPKAMARVTSEHWPRRELPSLPRGGPGTGLPFALGSGVRTVLANPCAHAKGTDGTRSSQVARRCKGTFAESARVPVQPNVKRRLLSVNSNGILR